MSTYTTCYNMCTQRAPSNFSEELYLRHGAAINDYLSKQVVGRLREAKDESLLRELLARWENHKIMNKWMLKFFLYLDRYFVKYHSHPTLEEVGLGAFRNTVFDEVKRPVATAVLGLIQRERGGAEVDRSLLKASVLLF